MLYDLADTLGHVVDLVLGHRRIQGQRNNARKEKQRSWAWIICQRETRKEPVQWNWDEVHAGPYAFLTQLADKLCPIDLESLEIEAENI